MTRAANHLQQVLVVADLLNPPFTAALTSSTNKYGSGVRFTVSECRPCFAQPAQVVAAQAKSMFTAAGSLRVGPLT